MSNHLAKPNFGRRRLIALLGIGALLIGGLVFANRGTVRDVFESFLGNSFPGPGHGSVDFVIITGDTGEDVATNLADQGIVKQFRSMYRLILDDRTLFYPGTYPMRLEMSNADALALLKDPANAKLNRLTVKEGWTVRQTFKALAEVTDFSVSEFESVSRDPISFGLPKAAPGLEGFIFPATYSFDPTLTPRQIVQQMVDRMFEELEDLGIPEEDYLKTLTLASIVQKEARLAPDFEKVARVFLNRIEVGMHLQSDATVSYGTNGTTVTTTDEQRADPNGYNTYLYAGLPVGPISNPGREAILAASSPSDGPWLFFCTVNLETGETIFSTTYSEHEVAVRKFQTWLRQNPGWNG